MHPFIKDRDMVTLTPLHLHGPLKEGDVVAFKVPHSNKLRLHRIVMRNGDTFLLKGDNISKPDGLIAAEDILAVATAIERNGRRVGGGLGSTKGLLAFLSCHNMLWVCNPKLLLLTPLAYMLRTIQRSKSYRMVLWYLRPTVYISKANQTDLEEAQDRLGFIESLNLNDTGFVARVYSKVVGYVGLVRYPQEDFVFSHNPHTNYWISGLFVWLPCRSLGIGKALCSHAIEYARAEGAKELIVQVNPENRVVIKICKDLGFQPGVNPSEWTKS